MISLGSNTGKCPSLISMYLTLNSSHSTRVQSLRSVGTRAPTGSRTIGELLRGRKSNGCEVKPSFFGAPQAKSFALEALHKRFSAQPALNRHLARRGLRVSALARRVAAAYGDANML